MTVELLPCPFCGGSMRFDSNRDWHRLTGNHEDGCVFDRDDPVMMLPAEDAAKAWATETWNTRSPAREGVEQTGTVSDYSDDRLLRSVVRYVTKGRPKRLPAWAKVSDAFGLGSTYSAQLCRRFGIDPDTGAALSGREGYPTA